MTIWVFDVETVDEKGQPILDATGKYFKLGCILKQNGSKKVFYNPKDMWQHILEGGIAEQKRGKKLVLFGHNIKYDYYNVADLKDKNIRWFSESPFIVGYYTNVKKIIKGREAFEKWQSYARFNRVRYEFFENEPNVFEINFKREAIKFIDNMNLFPMSLKDLGDIIGSPKLEMPPEVLEKATLEELAEYCLNDCKIVMDGLTFLKKKLKEEGVNVRNLCTISQIAITYVLKKLREQNAHILVLNKEGKPTELIQKSKYNVDIKRAYRGGLVRAFKTGTFDNVTSIDCNSLFPYMISNMRFPDLRSEKRIDQPLRFVKKEELFSKIGISRALVYNKSNNLGLLPIRMIHKSYVPLQGKYMLGTWTHLELSKALNEGYEVLDVEWSVVWDDSKNPFSEIYSELYRLRKEGDNEFNKSFYKRILNSSIGKFGQDKPTQELFVDSIENAAEYQKRGIKLIRGLNFSTDVLFCLQEQGMPKKYFCPIIPMLVTANSRMFMYDCFKRVGIRDLIYSDTDGIIAKGDFRSLFDMGKEMGQFKVEEDVVTHEPLVNVEAIIWGTKSKAVGNNLAVSGAFKSELNLEDFKQGVVKSKKMKGIKSGDNVGQFVEEDRDLKEQQRQLKVSEEILELEKLYIDVDINDINYFLPKITKDIVKGGNNK